MRIFEDDAFISVSANYKNIDSDEEKEDIAIISSITKEMEETIRKAPKFRRAFQPIDEVKQEPESPPPEKDNTKHNGSSSAASKSHKSPRKERRISRDKSPPKRHEDAGLVARLRSGFIALVCCAGDLADPVATESVFDVCFGGDFLFKVTQEVLDGLIALCFAQYEHRLDDFSREFG
ncbi:unnamed protein product [Heligmosomoides polygyrus]|uniref:Uncharacterized protein n=1 Tax=Heligmosomoides polygyrus TaxID=6339 RepID=A0A3P8EQI1_HELPZ|nr:unnamed protein product [Heligmosomoides polygyrus]